MRAALRPYTTAGVALVGASVIAVSPLAPPAEEIREATSRAVSEAQVQLSALANPIEEWAQVFETAFVNVANLGSQIAADPAPILSAIGDNQLITAEFFAQFAQAYLSGFLQAVGNVPASVEAAIQQIQAGNIEQGFSELVVALTLAPFVAPVLGAFEYLAVLPNVLSNPAQNVANVITTATSLTTLFNLIGVLTGALGPVLQVGISGQQVYDAIQAGDYEAALNAALSFPREVVNTTLNGNPAIPSGGILGSAPLPDAGIIKSFLDLRPVLAAAIAPPDLTPPSLMSTTFSPGEAGDTGLEGGQLISLSEGAETQEKQQDPPVAKSKTPDELTNSGATALVSKSGNAASGSTGTTTRKPGERLRAAFEGTADRIEKGFNDAVKGFDNALKGFAGRATNKDAGESAGAGAGVGAGAGAGASAGEGASAA